MVPYNAEEYESPADWFWIEVLEGCGCGSSERLAEIAWLLFQSWKDTDATSRISSYARLEYEILAHWMSSLDLIEHGSSIGYPWFTEKGWNVYEQVHGNGDASAD